MKLFLIGICVVAFIVVVIALYLFIVGADESRKKGEDLSDVASAPDQH